MPPSRLQCMTLAAIKCLKPMAPANYKLYTCRIYNSESHTKLGAQECYFHSESIQNHPTSTFYLVLDATQMLLYIVPDQSTNQSREAVLWIFIINTQVQPIQKIYIQGRINNTSTVLMAEGAALALATLVASLLQLQSPNYLSDNQQQVSFHNASDHSSPSDQRIKAPTYSCTATRTLTLDLQDLEEL